jgi:hypothetical protein
MASHEPTAATTQERLRGLLDAGSVHDPPWAVEDDDGQFYIRGKRGPGWYDVVAEEVPNRETADLIAEAVNSLPAILDLLDELRAGFDAFYEGDKSPLLNAEAKLRAL